MHPCIPSCAFDILSNIRFQIRFQIRSKYRHCFFRILSTPIHLSVYPQIGWRFQKQDNLIKGAIIRTSDWGLDGSLNCSADTNVSVKKPIGLVWKRDLLLSIGLVREIPWFKSSLRSSFIASIGHLGGACSSGSIGFGSCLRGLNFGRR